MLVQHNKMMRGIPSTSDNTNVKMGLDEIADVVDDDEQDIDETNGMDNRKVVTLW